jgi:hypothetical protein
MLKYFLSLQGGTPYSVLKIIFFLFSHLHIYGKNLCCYPLAIASLSWISHTSIVPLLQELLAILFV